MGEVSGTAKLEKEDEKRRVRVAEVGLTRGVVEDVLGEERVWLGGDELLDS